MVFQNSTLIILIVVAFAFYLVYSQNNQPKYIPVPTPIPSSRSDIGQTPCPRCEYYRNALMSIDPHYGGNYTHPQTTNVTLDYDPDPYSDPIKKQDLYTLYDPLTYPQLRLPREVLEKYNEYYERTGTRPPFNHASKPLFDNPILNGVLIKQVDENEPFCDNVPVTIPLFRVKSAKNANRYFYYIVDQRYLSKIELKIPLDHVKINGVRYNNADFYGLPELYDGDIIENIPIYPNVKFRVLLYKTFHFP
ncbi:MAG: hypothetical protein QXW79_00620 [Thermoplasmata archaeon]